MRNLIIVSMLGALVFGCGKDDSKGSSAAKAGESKASATDYTAIDSMVAKAKTSDEFIDIVMECGKIEIDTRGKATNDPVHVQACSVSPTHARAKLAIAESTPDKMSIHCITASMNLDELIEKKLALEDSKKLLAQVNKACDM